MNRIDEIRSLHLATGNFCREDCPTCILLSEVKRLEADNARGAPPSSAASPCEHEWIDARNAVILSGSYCAKCLQVKVENASGNCTISPIEPNRIDEIANQVDRLEDCGGWCCPDEERLAADAGYLVAEVKRLEQLAKAGEQGFGCDGCGRIFAIADMPWVRFGKRLCGDCVTAYDAKHRAEGEAQNHAS